MLYADWPDSPRQTPFLFARRDATPRRFEPVYHVTSASVVDDETVPRELRPIAGDRRGNGAVSHVLFLRPFAGSATVYDTVRRVQGVVPWRVSVRRARRGHGRQGTRVSERYVVRRLSRDFPRIADEFRAWQHASAWHLLAVIAVSSALRREQCFVDDNITSAARRFALSVPWRTQRSGNDRSTDRAGRAQLKRLFACTCDLQISVMCCNRHLFLCTNEVSCYCLLLDAST